METLKLNNPNDLPKNYTGIVEYDEGTIIYYLNGKCHREDGPAIIHPDGSIFYYLNGKCHREDGPAAIWNDGTVFYYLNGKRHREDGPAAIWNDGTVFYYINHIDITKEVNDWLSGKTDIPPYEKWYNNTRLIFKLTFG